MKNLILSVGGTPDPLVKSIEMIKPHKVIFIASQETSSTIKAVREFTSDQQYKDKIIILTNSEDLHEVFQVGYEAKRYLIEGEVYVDYTGGTKSMSVGLALSFFGKDIKEYLYIGGDERQKEGIGTVKPGYEKLIQKIDPANLYSFNIARRVEQLFNIGQYKLVFHILDNEIPKNNSSHQNIKELGQIKNLANALHLWDSMNYHQSYAEIKKYQKETANLLHLLFQVDIPENFENHLKKCKDDNPGYKVNDLVLAAQRKKEQGEYDEAVLRIYRSIEYIGQIAFQKRFDCKTSNVLLRKLECIKSTDVYNKIKGRLRNTVSLSLNDTYEILHETGVKEGQIYIKYKREFQSFNNMRHQSVLAHGFESCNEKNVEDGLKLIKHLTKNISKVKYPSIRFLF